MVARRALVAAAAALALACSAGFRSQQAVTAKIMTCQLPRPTESRERREGYALFKSCGNCQKDHIIPESRVYAAHYQILTKQQNNKDRRQLLESWSNLLKKMRFQTSGEKESQFSRDDGQAMALKQIQDVNKYKFDDAAVRRCSDEELGYVMNLMSYAPYMVSNAPQGRSAADPDGPFGETNILPSQIEDPRHHRLDYDVVPTCAGTTDQIQRNRRKTLLFAYLRFNGMMVGTENFGATAVHSVISAWQKCLYPDQSPPGTRELWKFSSQGDWAKSKWDGEWFWNYRFNPTHRELTAKCSPEMYDPVQGRCSIYPEIRARTIHWLCAGQPLPVGASSC
jgi:hypothetical protein